MGITHPAYASEWEPPLRLSLLIQSNRDREGSGISRRIHLGVRPHRQTTRLIPGADSCRAKGVLELQLWLYQSNYPFPE
jgi:hypothetical protein